MRQNVMMVSVSKNLSEVNKKLLNSEVIDFIRKIGSHTERNKNYNDKICHLHRYLIDGDAINSQWNISTIKNILDNLTNDYLTNQ